MIRLLTDSKNPIVVSRRRFAIYFLIGSSATVAFALLLSFLGAVAVAMPMHAIFGFFVASKAHPMFMLGLACVASLAIWVGQYYAGRWYMALVSRLGFEHRKEVLTPLFLPSLGIWSLVAVSVLMSSGVNFGAIAVVLGIAFNLIGQRQKVMALRRALPNDVPITKIESSGDFIDHLFALKSAESIEHLEQLSKQCLAIIKPAATASADCTSVLIDELMKRKLRVEADELSMLQLKLIDHQEH